MKKVHFVGVGGAGTSAAAALAKSVGFEVSGCDLDQNSAYLNELESLGVNISDSHNAAHLHNLYILVISATIEKSDFQNPEVLEAKKKNLPILSTEKFVSEYLTKNKFLIAVAGTHGKSTTTAMIGRILEDANLDPTVYVGAIVTKWGKNYRFGKSKYFVIEADEYEDKFLNYNPNVGVITNIEYDHPDYFKNEEQLVESFVKFVEGFAKDSKLIVGPRPEESANIKRFSQKIDNISSVEKEFGWRGEELGIDLKVAGEHNILNAKAAYLCAKAMGLDDEQIKKSLSRFSGIARRFEFIGEVNDIKMFDDYAHHPSEVAATLSAVREKFPRERIWCVFQPHTFSRTQALFEDFVRVFENALIDKLIIVDIFAAREKSKDISAVSLAKKLKEKQAIYIGEIEEVATYIAKNASSGDVVIAMGAGDIYKLSRILLNKLKGQKW